MVRTIDCEATLGKLHHVIQIVNEELEAVDCDMRTTIQIDVAVEEIFVNIARYAYAPETGPVTICIDASVDKVQVTFMDGGVPFNPLDRPDPDVTLPADKRKIGGLGIYMVKRSMDDVHYEYRDGQNVFTITKFIKRSED